jgi:hypothetical protein
MHRKLWVLGVLVIVALIGAPFQLGAPHHTQAQDTTALSFVVFTSDVAGNYDLYHHDLTTGLNTLLTGDEANEVDPALDPGGQWVAFASDQDGDFDLYAMGSDTLNTVRLTDNSEDDRQPRWLGPDILVYLSRLGEVWELFLLTFDGNTAGTPVQLSENGDPVTFDLGDLDVSTLLPLIYATNQAGNFDLYWLDLAAGTSAALTSDPANEFDPSVSPDGDWVLYASDTEGNFDLVLLRTDGSESQQLTFTDDDERQPQWISEDRILYASNAGGSWNLFTMSLEDGTSRQLTDDAASELGPELEGLDATVAEPPPLEVTVGSDRLNIRASPGTGAPVLTVVNQGDILRVIGRLADNSWLQVITPDDVTGWAFADLLVIDTNLDVVPVVDATFVAPPPPAAATPAPPPSTGGTDTGGGAPPPPPTNPPPEGTPGS